MNFLLKVKDYTIERRITKYDIKVDREENNRKFRDRLLTAFAKVF